MGEVSPLWEVYMILTRKGDLYTGITTDLARRWKEHKDRGSRKGAKFFALSPPLKIVYRQSFPNRSEASKRERQIKKLRKIHKLALIREWESGQAATGV